MTLQELIISVKEKNLTKEQLENYHGEMSHLYAEMQIEMAEIEKEEALFLDQDHWGKVSEVQRKREWKGTDRGQRLIVLKRYCLATKELISSLRSRTFRLIY